MTSVEIAEESFGDDARAVTAPPCGLGRAGRRAPRARCGELRGSKELITAQRCARTPALKALVTLDQGADVERGENAGKREDLRTRPARIGSAEARREDFKADGDAKYLD